MRGRVRARCQGVSPGWGDGSCRGRDRVRRDRGSDRRRLRTGRAGGGGFSNYDRIYGSFAGVIVFALWMWIASMALLVGVEFDAEVERIRELRAGMPAETQVQLPLRDAARIGKVVRNDRADAAEARRIREDSTDAGQG